MTPGLFSKSAIDKHVEILEARDGNTLDLGVEAAPSERPAFTIDAQGEHTSERVDLTWGAWAKTQFSKASTAIGAKIGIRGP